MPLISLPVWQNGTPQSMQRAPWLRSRFSSRCGWNSSQSPMRSMGARSTGSSRRYSMNPVGFPIVVLCRSVAADAREVARILLAGFHDGLVADQAALFRPRDAGEHALVVLRDDLDELRQHVVPAVQHEARAFARGVRQVALDEPAHLADLRFVGEA